MVGPPAVQHDEDGDDERGQGHAVAHRVHQSQPVALFLQTQLYGQVTRTHTGVCGKLIAGLCKSCLIL